MASSRIPQNRLQISFYILLAGVTLAPISAPLLTNTGYEPDFAMGSIYMISAVLACIAYLWYLKKTKSHTVVLEGDTLLLAVAALTFWATLSMSWAPNTYEAMVKLPYLWVALLTMALVRQMGSVFVLKHVATALFVSGLMIALLGIVQHLTGFSAIPQASPPSATFANKNFAAQYVTLTLPFGLFLVCNYKNKTVQALAAIAIALMLLYQIYNTTRAAWLATLVQGIALAIVYFVVVKPVAQNFYNRAVLLKWSIALLILLCGIFWSSGEFDTASYSKIGSEFGSIAADASTKTEEGSIRIAMWINSILMLKDFGLFGTGIGNWNLYYPLYHQQLLSDWVIGSFKITNNAHNDYIEYAVELGIVGILLALFIFWLVFRFISERLKQSHNWQWYLCIMLAFIGIAVESFFSFPFQKPTPIIFVAFLLGCLQLRPVRLKAVAQIKVLITPAILAFCCVFFLSLHYIWNQYNGINSYYRMMHAATIRSSIYLVQEADKALQYFPHRGDIYYYKGSAYRLVSNHKPAIIEFEKALTYYPYHIPTLNKVSKSYLRLNDYVNASKHLKTLVTIAPNRAKDQKRLGVILNNNLNDIKGAIFHIKKALELQPDISDNAKLRNLLKHYGVK